MNKKIKSLLYNLAAFAIFYSVFVFAVLQFTTLDGFTARLVAFGITLFIAPKFQSVKTPNGEKIFMKWIFVKGIREIQ